jgi:hypothetical protein
VVSVMAITTTISLFAARNGLESICRNLGNFYMRRPYNILSTWRTCAKCDIDNYPGERA